MNSMSTTMRTTMAIREIMEKVPLFDEFDPTLVITVPSAVPMEAGISAPISIATRNMTADASESWPSVVAIPIDERYRQTAAHITYTGRKRDRAMSDDLMGMDMIRS